MTKTKKKQQGKKSKKSSSSQLPKKRDTQNQLQTTIAEANAQTNPLTILPAAFLTVPLSPPPGSRSKSRSGVVNRNDGTASVANDSKDVAIIQHFSSPLPPNILEQCLELFKMNMGDMYQQSSWGLDVEEKLKELQHVNARFLVVLSTSTTATTEAGIATNNNDAAADVTSKKADNETTTTTKEKGTVLGFAHFRYEPDDEDHPAHPVSYLYELQIRRTVQNLGLGKKLMTIIELLSIKLHMKKCMLTVFRSNEAAMGFYVRRKYVVDEFSPSNFEGGEECDYEILSKSFG